ncbi:murein L,D-transpeptidase [Thiocystis minor]|uniref:L,D-transpeptidase family protein n=1 Tax=Thiocystis minor TaxID=61597 RepID=UPI001914770C|nr:L,D-transpeptidase family protein [Thiocystis minor]MBK5964863.1 murein L,D-transpeptidase [Thiocystis minor]
MKFHVYPSIFSLLLAFLPALAHPSSLLGRTLESLRESETAAVDGVHLLSGRLLAEFYARRDHQPVWTEPARIDALLLLVEESRLEGFAPQDFHVETLRELSLPHAFDALSEAERIGADIKLSDALLRYVHHTRFGKLDPVAVDPKRNDRKPVPAEQLLADMMGALEADDPDAFLSSRFQYPFWYEDLKRGLARYLGKANLEGLAPLPAGAILMQGNRDPRVALVRERLRLIDDHEIPVPSDATRFDESLHAAVVAFQRRFGLSADGAVGPATIAALNQPFDAGKVERIRINLERMRWLYNDLDTDYVFVDVANYKAHVVRDGGIVWSTRVIVGEKDAQTPMFRDTMDHLVFNPTWTVPISIQKTMGRVSSSYTLVDRRTGRKSSGGDASNYKRYQVVQQPGPRNALGRVKFMFPNRHSVYLHDTPNKGLFARDHRALSHGCVRVQDPVRLAEILLQESNWDRGRIDQVLGSSRTRYVNLEKTLPVLLYYLTARADEHGAVRFRPDIYERDQSLLDMFAGPVLRTRIAFPEPPAVPDSESAPALPPAPTDPDLDAPPASNAVRLTQTESPAP